jgi:hypothetical protein
VTLPAAIRALEDAIEMLKVVQAPGLDPDLRARLHEDARRRVEDVARGLGT